MGYTLYMVKLATRKEGKMEGNNNNNNNNNNNDDNNSYLQTII